MGAGSSQGFYSITKPSCWCFSSNCCDFCLISETLMGSLVAVVSFAHVPCLRVSCLKMCWALSALSPLSSPTTGAPSPADSTAGPVSELTPQNEASLNLVHSSLHDWRKAWNQDQIHPCSNLKLQERSCLTLRCQLPNCRGFPGGPVVKNPPSNAGYMGSVCQRTKILHAAGQLSTCAATSEKPARCSYWACVPGSWTPQLESPRAATREAQGSQSRADTLQWRPSAAKREREI